MFSRVLFTCIQGKPRSNNKMNSCAVFDIFQQGATDNADRGKTKIYANAYITLLDGTTFMAHDNTKQWIGGSLYDVLAVLENKYFELDTATQDQLYDFACQWRAVITEYGFENLMDDLIPEE